MIGHLTEAAFVRSYGGQWITKDGRKVFVKDTTFGFHGSPSDSAGGTADPEAAGLDEADIKAVQKYTSLDFLTINLPLRNLDKGLDALREQSKPAVAALDAALAKSPLPEPVVTYRGLHGGPWTDSLKVGDTFRDPGFFSTTTERDTAIGIVEPYAKKGVVMEVHVPAGVHGIHVKPEWQSTEGGKNLHELLLERDLSMVVAGMETDDAGIQHFHMEVSPPAAMGRYTAAAFCRAYGGQWITKDGRKVFIKDQTFGFHGAPAPDSAGGSQPESAPDPYKVGAAVYDARSRDYTNAEKEAARNYQQTGYDAINGALRSYGKVPASTLEAIDSAIANAKLPQAVVVFRGFAVPGNADWDQMVGQEFKDRGYVSTTLNEKVMLEEYEAGGKGTRSLRATIHLPEGAPALPMEMLKANDEFELLLPRNSRFRVTGVTHDKKETHLLMEWMGADE